MIVLAEKKKNFRFCPHCPKRLQALNALWIFLNRKHVLPLMCCASPGLLLRGCIICTNGVSLAGEFAALMQCK